jgi:hypothetical protein
MTSLSPTAQRPTTSTAQDMRGFGALRQTAPTDESLNPPTTHALTDEERESAIRWAGMLVNRHAASGDFEKARWAMRSMYSLIEGRTKAQIARMEQERGLT